MKIPKYFYFRIKAKMHGTAIEVEDASNEDVVEVVRCKDCRHNHDCNIQYHAQAGEEFYCGVAERRIDGKNQN